jgi:hypothetical protein
MIIPGERWAIEFRSNSRLDGPRRHFIWNGCGPLLFLTRQEARAYIAERYGYINNPGRRELRKEPYCWRIPAAVKVRVQLIPCAQIDNTSRNIEAV